MITTKKASGEMAKKSYKEGRQDVADSIKEWHLNYQNKQSQMESEFVFHSIENIPINIWDDYTDDNKTHAQIELNEMPDSVCFEVLLHLLTFARNNPEITKTGSTFSLLFDDPTGEYPEFFGDKIKEHALHKQWQLEIRLADFDTRELVVCELQKCPAFNGKRLNIFSES